MYELNCRRCGSPELLELARLAGEDHTVFRCRICGFLFSPPEGSARTPGVEPSPLRGRGGHPHPRIERGAGSGPLPSREREPLSRGG